MDSRTLIAMFFVLCALVCLSYAAVDVEKHCKPGHFYSLRKERCTLCSLCKKHQVPLVQCHGNRDTLCGTLGNFEFRQKSAGKDGQGVKTEVIYELPKSSKEALTTQTSTTPVTEDKWFAITMVLIGILVFTCILGVILVFVTCYMCRRKEREIIYDPVYTSSLIKDGQITEPMYQQFKVVTEAQRV